MFSAIIRTTFSENLVISADPILWGVAITLDNSQIGYLEGLSTSGFHLGSHQCGIHHTSRAAPAILFSLRAKYKAFSSIIPALATFQTF